MLTWEIVPFEAGQTLQEYISQSFDTAAGNNLLESGPNSPFPTACKPGNELWTLLTGLLSDCFRESKFRAVGTIFVADICDIVGSILLDKENGDLMTSIRKLLDPVNPDILLRILEIVAHLSSNNMLSDTSLDNIFRSLISSGQLPALQSFFSTQIPTVNAFAENTFNSAVRVGCVELVQMFLHMGADVNSVRYTIHGTQRRPPLLAAVERENVELVRILLNAGADANSREPHEKNEGDTALIAALEKNNVCLVETLLQSGADANTSRTIFPSQTPLGIAVLNGNRELVQCLLDAGADVNAHPHNFNIMGRGPTALQTAAAKGSLSFTRILLNAGAMVSLETPYPDGSSAILVAAKADGDNVDLGSRQAKPVLGDDLDEVFVGFDVGEDRLN